MKYLLTILTMIAGFLFQTTILQEIRIFGILPNLALILIVVFSIRFDLSLCISAAITGGILQDFFFSPAFGIYTLIYLVIAIAVSEISDIFFEESGAAPILMMLFSTACQYLLMIVIYYFAGMQFNLSAIFLRMIAPEMVLNAIICWGVFRLFSKNFEKYEKKGVGR